MSGLGVWTNETPLLSGVMMVFLQELPIQLILIGTIAVSCNCDAGGTNMTILWLDGVTKGGDQSNVSTWTC